MKRPFSHRRGDWGEDLTAKHLKQKGYRVIGVRVRVDRRDEIDIIARDGEVLVFVEVKARKSERFGRPADAVNRAKREVLSRAAVRYMKGLRQSELYFRFDVVEVIGAEDDYEIRHIENAFNLSSRYRYP